MRKKKNKKRIKIIIITTTILLLVMSAGYAAFQTNLSITATGRIYDISEKCFTTADNGDGTVTITDYDATCGTTVNIPKTIKGKTVTKIGSTPYNVLKSFNHKGLTSVVIPDTVTSIGAYAFYGNKISHLELGSNLEYISAEAFHSNQLTNIIFPKSLKSIGSGAFLNNKLTSIPNLDGISYGNGAFARNEVEGENAFIYSRKEDGSLDYTKLNSYAGKYTRTLNIPEGIKTIEFYALRYVSAYEVNLPNTIETIGTSAIMQSGASIINIPSSIKNIDPYGFSQSTQISTINIDRSKDSIPNAPWGATNATVNWTGSN